MNTLARPVISEFIKLRHSPFVWITFAAFSLGPIMGGLAMYLVSDTSLDSGILEEKAIMMAFGSDWNSYLQILSQVVGVGGIIVFGFVASWIFGREYADKTAKNLLALPTSRAAIINAKFATYLLWCFALVISNLIIGLIIGYFLPLGELSLTTFAHNVIVYLTTFLLVVLLGTPISFMGIFGKGYMAPLGLVVMLIVFSQIIGALGVGHYFPWAVPGIFSGISADMKASIDYWSYTLIIMTSLIGFIATHLWWQKADQH